MVACPLQDERAIQAMEAIYACRQHRSYRSGKQISHYIRRKLELHRVRHLLGGGVVNGLGHWYRSVSVIPLPPAAGWPSREPMDRK